MISFWDKIIQNLIVSNGVAEILLAVHLCDDPLSVVHWFWLNKQNCEDLDLPYLSNLDSTWITLNNIFKVRYRLMHVNNSNYFLKEETESSYSI